MTVLLIIIHVIVCIALIMIVLLQTGKGADMGAAFGTGSSQTLFGSSGSTVLTKATTVAAVVFMLTSFCLAYVSGQKTGSSVMRDAAPIEQKQSAPEQAAPQTGTEKPAAKPESSPNK